MAQISWVFDELVLAAELLQQNNWTGVRRTDPRAVELSALLGQGSLHPGVKLPDNFRSPSSIQRKTYDLATAIPEYAGKRTRSSKLDQLVIERFRHDPDALQQLAAAVRAALHAGEKPPAELEPSAFEVEEGGLIEYVTTRRERDPSLRSKKIEAVLEAGISLSCEACSFNFEQIYGSRGSGYVEVHHITPLYVSGKTRTTLDDLALLCSNCHRMCHRTPWMTPTELKQLITEQTK